MPKPNDPVDQTSDAAGYVGRFAPSPTGPLHFGSLLAALASFLDARAHGGKWLVRVEDLDPPREPEGSAELILTQLNDLGLIWDGDVLYQSSRLDAYEAALADLFERELCYPCDCTRGQIKDMGNVYNGACRARSQAPQPPFAIRIKTIDHVIAFTDGVQGDYSQNVGSDVGDFVLRRKDTLFAYQLAVVVDDAFQGITDIVRGWDLLDSTPRQIYLQEQLGFRQPNYAHIPIIVDEQGQKLSKQAFAPAIETSEASALIFLALQLLGQNPPAEIEREACAVQLEWAIQNWRIDAVPEQDHIPFDTGLSD